MTGSLTATKTAKEIVGPQQEALQQSDADDRTIERAHAAADLMRSYAFFGFLEYLQWATRALGLFLTLRWGIEFLASLFGHERHSRN